jgi:hypothetical protein
MNKMVKTRMGEAVQDPPIVTKLLNHPLAAWLWLPIRLWLAWQWVQAGLDANRCCPERLLDERS